ncbi:MAG: Mrp/NBP35 family ATP-binding protein [Elusimicrobiota bacterium]
MITTNEILGILKKIIDPDLGKDIVTLGFVRNIVIDKDKVNFDINLTTPACPVKNQMQAEAQRLVASLPGVATVAVNMTSEVRSSAPAKDKTALAGVKNIIAIGSGKGGVGKSTVSTNLAVGLAQTGAKVGLLDADIYGPSIPIMMGPNKLLEVKGNKIEPATAHGVKFMSMGFMAPADKPLIWRGPMAHGALSQSLFDVLWGELDYLLVDLPPGTGDIHITLCQSIALTGAVLVSTPQDVGLTIALKTFRLFEIARVPMLGLIENMSHYVCPHCHERDDIFGNGGVKAAAERLHLPYLGEIPLDTSIRKQADSGTPIIMADPKAPSSLAYRQILEKLAAQISIVNMGKPQLQVVEE